MNNQHRDQEIVVSVFLELLNPSSAMIITHSFIHSFIHCQKSKNVKNNTEISNFTVARIVCYIRFTL